VGLGGLGIPVAQYLNAMGVGTLGLADQDIVELHNLQRQVLYTENHIGRPKIEVVGAFLREQNSETEIREHDTFLSRSNALEILSAYDLIVDATDNFPSRYLINDTCIILRKPFVYGALHGFEGQVSVFNYKGGATYRCLFPEMPGPEEIPDCNKNGVLGILPGIVGTLQALEVVKCLTGVGEVLSEKLLLYNGLDQSFHKIQYQLNPENQKINVLQEDYGVVGCKSDAAISAVELMPLLEDNKAIQLIDVRNREEFAAYNIPGSRNIPLSECEALSGTINRARPVYFICATGQRSFSATQFVKQRYPGIVAYNVEGGLRAYRALSP
jgi:adenylyltransferase/sulfurtransferase